MYDEEQTQQQYEVVLLHCIDVERRASIEHTIPEHSSSMGPATLPRAKKEEGRFRSRLELTQAIISKLLVMVSNKSKLKGCR